MIYKYKEFVKDIFEKVAATQFENIIKAGTIIAQNTAKGGDYWVFGPGHSHEMTETMMENVGSLSFMKPLFVHDLGKLSLYSEQKEVFAKVIIDYADFKKGDTLLIVSNSGINGATVEVGRFAKEEKGATLIGVSNMIQSKKASPRHSSGKKLYEYADLTIDNCGEYNDAAFEVKKDIKMGATSGAVGCFICHAVNMVVNMICLDNGITEKELQGCKKELIVNEGTLLTKLNEYFEKYMQVFEETFNANIDNLKQAAKIAATAVQKEKVSYLYGAGHDHNLCEEITSRAGTIMCNRAVLFDVLQLNNHPKLWKQYLEIEECGNTAFRTITLDPEDSFLMFNQSASETGNVAIAKSVKEVGSHLILFTNRNMEKNCVSKHSSGKKVTDFADLIIDVKAPANDSLINYKGVDLCPCFQSVSSFLAQSFVILQGLELDSMGINLPVRKSINTDEGKEWNEMLNRKYGHLTRV